MTSMYIYYILPVSSRSFFDISPSSSPFFADFCRDVCLLILLVRVIPSSDPDAIRLRPFLRKDVPLLCTGDMMSSSSFRSMCVYKWAGHLITTLNKHVNILWRT